MLFRSETVPSFDLLNLPRPASPRPWAYVKIAEGCDHTCGFCAIPTFRGPQRSRDVVSILAEVEALEALGIDPIHYLVVPRVLGLALSSFSLTVYMILGAFGSGFLVKMFQRLSR